MTDDGPASGDPATEWRRIVEAVAEVRRDIEHLRALTLREMGETEAGIFDAHLTLLADSEMLADVRQRIGSGLGASAAWTACLSDIEHQWSELPDAYLRERAADVRAVRDQVRRVLAGVGNQQTVAEGVLVARDLTPAQAAGLDISQVKGIVLAAGSPSSHAAILARSRAIPLVVSAGRDVLSVPEGTPIVVDGSTGEVHVDPDAGGRRRLPRPGRRPGRAPYPGPGIGQRTGRDPRRHPDRRRGQPRARSATPARPSPRAPTRPG